MTRTINKARLQNELQHITREIGNIRTLDKKRQDNEWLWKLYGKEQLLHDLLREVDDE